MTFVVVFAVGVVITLNAVLGWVSRRRYDRHHDTRPNEIAITRWGFFMLPLKVGVGLFALGLVLILVGGIAALL